ncbi:MAG: hypothetical protein AB1938_15720 [Myxococcota bacterium]
MSGGRCIGCGRRCGVSWADELCFGCFQGFASWAQRRGIDLGPSFSPTGGALFGVVTWTQPARVAFDEWLEAGRPGPYIAIVEVEP